MDVVKSLFTDAGVRGVSGREAKIWRPLSRSTASAPEPPPAERICEASAERVAAGPAAWRAGGQERGRGEQSGDEAIRPSHRSSRVGNPPVGAKSRWRSGRPPEIPRQGSVGRQ